MVRVEARVSIVCKGEDLIWSDRMMVIVILMTFIILMAMSVMLMMVVITMLMWWSWWPWNVMMRWRWWWWWWSWSRVIWCNEAHAIVYVNVSSKNTVWYMHSFWSCKYHCDGQVSSDDELLSVNTYIMVTTPANITVANTKPIKNLNLGSKSPCWYHLNCSASVRACLTVCYAWDGAMVWDAVVWWCDVVSCCDGVTVWCCKWSDGVMMRWCAGVMLWWCDGMMVWCNVQCCTLWCSVIGYCGMACCGVWVSCNLMW